MTIKTRIGSKIPEPQVDMIIQDNKGNKYVLKPCTCDPEKEAWPKAKYYDCGPHLWLLNPDGTFVDCASFVCYKFGRGWLDNYLIIEERIISKILKISACPLCGCNGDDLVFAFYCSNFGCRNYKI